MSLTCGIKCGTVFSAFCMSYNLCVVLIMCVCVAVISSTLIRAFTQTSSIACEEYKQRGSRRSICIVNKLADSTISRYGTIKNYYLK